MTIRVGDFLYFLAVLQYFLLAIIVSYFDIIRGSAFRLRVVCVCLFSEGVGRSTRQHVRGRRAIATGHRGRVPSGPRANRRDSV